MIAKFSSSSRFPLVCAAVLTVVSAVGFLSCQSSGPSDPVQGPQLVTASLSYSDAWKRPDSLTWAIGSRFPQAITAKEITATQITGRFALAESTKDTIYLGLWTAGMRLAQVSFLQIGTSTDLKSIDIVLDDIALALLEELPDASQRKRDSLYLRYARHLVDGDSAFKGFPATAPMGIDTQTVIRLGLAYAIAKQIPLDAIAKIWSLGIDPTTLHARVQELVASGKVAAADTIKAFPPYPVRVKTRLALDGLVPGQTVAVRGVFTGDSGLTKIGWKVFQGSVDRTVSFRLGYSAQLDGTQTAWDLEKDASATLTEVTAGVGTYELVVWISDAKDRVDTSRVTFEVSAIADNAPPSLEWISPTGPSKTLEFQDSVFLVRVRASDASGLASVTINGEAAVTVGADLTRELEVPVSDTGILVTVKAVDNAGNARADTTRLIRKPAPKANDPRIVSVSPTEGSAIPFETRLVKFSWKVVDPLGKIDSVLIQGKLAAKQDSIYSRDVEIEPTGEPTRVTLLLYARGSKTAYVESATITRLADKNGPSIRWIAPVGAAYLAHADSLYVVRVAVSDPSGVGVVDIADSQAVATDSVWSRSVKVSVGGQGKWVKVEASDKAGNISTDSVQLFRAEAPVAGAPVVVLQSPSGKTENTLVFDSAFVTATWRIVDLTSGIDSSSVKIGGVAATYLGDSSWSARVPVPATGVTTIVSLEARNKAGLGAVDFFYVSRAKDAVVPVVKRSGGLADQSVPFATTTFDLEWTVSDNDSVASVALNGSKLPVAASVKKTVDLVVGSNPFKITVTDLAGNASMDSVTITRAQDATGPVVSKVAGTADKTVSYATTTATVSWTVTDNDAVLTVKIGGKAVTSATTTFSSSVPLDVGSNAITIEAFDKAGNSTTDMVTITRLNDTVTAVVANDLNTALRAGTFWVKLTCATTGATIRYTLDGSEPTESSALYADGIQIDSSRTLKARGFASPRVAGHILTVEYNLAVPVAVSGGANHTLVLMSDGSLWGFGGNESNAFIEGDQGIRSTPEKIDDNVAQMAAGKQFSLWVKTDGSLWGIGANGSGQLADGTTTMKSKRVQIPFSGKVAKVVTSIGNETMILKTDGTLWGAGANSYGELGLGYTSSVESSPIQVASGVSDMGVGGGMGFFLKSGAYYSMGYYGDGRLGFEASAFVTTPTKVAQLDGATVIDQHVGQSNFVGKSDGSLWVFGWNPNGILGTGDSANVWTPKQIALSGNVAQIATGGGHALVLMSNGTLYGCGGNEYGQIGISASNATNFIEVASGVASISAGYWTSLYIRNDNTLWGLGDKSWGALGSGTANPTRIRF